MKMVLICLLFSLTASTAFAAVSKLNPPQKDGGPSVLAAIESRSSAPGGTFPATPLSDDDLSTILWAASGKSRNGKGWTVPTAMQHDPYCDIYLATSAGVFLYLPGEHALKEVSKANIKEAIAMQGFAQQAPQVLIFVGKGEALSAFSGADKQTGFANVLVGAMTQNIYLAAEALGVGVRYVASLNHNAVVEELKLGKNDLPIAIMPLGKK